MKRPAELDLFSEEPENIHVEKVQWSDIKTTTVLGNDIQGLQFTIPKASDRKMIDLNRTQLMLDIKFEKVAADDTKKFAPVNNTLHSLFENCVISMNGEVVYDSNKNYHYSAYILDLLDRSQDQKEGLLTAQLWYPDTGAQFDTLSGTNKGFEKRQKKTLLDLDIPMIGRLHSELFNQERYMISDVEIGVELTLAKDTFYIMSSHEGTGKYRLKISQARLSVPYVQVAAKTVEDIEKALETTPVSYPIQRVHTKTIPIGTTSADLTIDISKGRLPKRVIMGLVEDTAKVGAYTKNPYMFSQRVAGIYELTKLELNVDSMPYGKKGFTKNFGGNIAHSLFTNLYESLNYIQDGTNAPILNVYDYVNGYFLIPFNLNPGCTSDPGTYKKEGTVSVDITFQKAPTKALSLVVMTIYDQVIRIDKDRNVQTDGF